MASTSVAEEFRSLPASKRKIQLESSSKDENKCDDGFRLIDLAILMSVFKAFICPKMGLASQLSLKCSALMCTYSMEFNTSNRVNTSKAFEVNRRVVLAEEYWSWPPRAREILWCYEDVVTNECIQ